MCVCVCGRYNISLFDVPPGFFKEEGEGGSGGLTIERSDSSAYDAGVGQIEGTSTSASSRTSSSSSTSTSK